MNTLQDSLTTYPISTWVLLILFICFYIWVFFQLRCDYELWVIDSKIGINHFVGVYPSLRKLHKQLDKMDNVLVHKIVKVPKKHEMN